jgi:hypothetical protein
MSAARRRIGALLVAMLSINTHAGDFMSKSVKVKDKDVAFEAVAHDPPLVIRKDAAGENQASALNCSRLMFSRLAQGDIAGAAKLSNDPAAVTKKYTDYRERLGEAEFRQQFAGYFSGGAALKYEIRVGRRHLLIVHDAEMEMDMAQVYVENGGTFLADEKDSAERSQVLGVFAALKDPDSGVVTVR